MVRLVGGVVDRREDIVAFEKRIVLQDFIEGSSRAKKFQNVGDTKALAANAGAASALAFLHGDSMKTLQIHIA
jgi:hypothetical protein